MGRGVGGEWWWMAAVVGIAVAGGLLRAAWLGLQGPHVDEGLWALPAKQYVVKGDWAFGCRRLPTPELAPGFFAFTAASFKLLGPSLCAARLVSVLWGTAAILLVGLIGRRIFGPRAGLLAAALTAASFTWVRASRQALLEATACGTFLLGLYLLLAGGRWRWIGAVAFGVSILSKLYTLALLPVGLVLGWEVDGRRRGWAYAGVLLVALGVAGAGFACIDAKHHRAVAEFRRQFVRRGEVDWGAKFRAGLLVPGRLMPLTWAAGLLAMVAFAFAGRAGERAAGALGLWQAAVFGLASKDEACGLRWFAFAVPWTMLMVAGLWAKLWERGIWRRGLAAYAVGVLAVNLAAGIGSLRSGAWFRQAMAECRRIIPSAAAVVTDGIVGVELPNDVVFYQDFAGEGRRVQYWPEEGEVRRLGLGYAVLTGDWAAWFRRVNGMGLRDYARRHGRIVAEWGEPESLRWLAVVELEGAGRGCEAARGGEGR